MSTINPDEQARRIRGLLRPAAFVVLVIGVIDAPIMAALVWFGSVDTIGAYLVWLFITTFGGIFALGVLQGGSILMIAAYCASGVGGMLLMLGANSWLTSPGTFGSLIAAGVFYVIAAGLVGIHRWLVAAVTLTAVRGVDTTGTIISAGVTGMVNNVQLQRLTVQFVDNNGVTRYIRVSRVSGAYRAGQTLPVRYDPERPGATHAIVVGS
ncbi:MAG: DUF3592 domain-containing protein [Rhodoglobus sp.]